MAAAALPLALACANTKRASRPASPEVVDLNRPADAAAPVQEDAAKGAPCDGDDACPSNQICVSQRCVDVTPGLAECQRVRAHFDFDRALVREVDRPALARAARCLLAMPSQRAAVEGNCDERGTAQYNLALGYRRASAVLQYLEALGVPAGQMSAVSYGKEAPLCTDSTEACWAENRRADVAPGRETKDAGAQQPAPVPARHEISAEQPGSGAAGN